MDPGKNGFLVNNWPIFESNPNYRNKFKIFNEFLSETADPRYWGFLEIKKTVAKKLITKSNQFYFITKISRK